LSNCHIKTAAVQERLLAPLWMWHKIVLDYYFIFGASTEEVIKKGLEWCHVKNTHKVGVLKTDIVKNEETKGINRKYKRIKDECFILLALDYIPTNYKIENVEYAVSNWKNLKIFYIDMIRLASNIPGLFIIIKGKDASIITHPEFQDIFNIINAMPNIKVVDDVITDSPSKMIALADAAVALYTSMADELLAAGKPVIFYDYFGIPSPYFNYENYPVIVKTYHELEKRICKLVSNNDFMDAQQFNEMRCRLYEGNANGKVKSILNKRLENMYFEVSA